MPPSVFEASVLDLDLDPLDICLFPGDRPARGTGAAGCRFAGDPKCGKSLLTCYFAAVVPRGFRWPDRPLDHTDPGGVVMFSADDYASDTIVPRLIAAEADLARVHIVTGVREPKSDTETPFNLEQHLRHFERLLQAHPDVDLVTIDPISPFLGKTDSHVNSEVRGVLTPLAALAAKYEVAVVAITHLNKDGGGAEAIYRTMGSLAFTAAARAVWLVICDNSDKRRKLVLNIGMNLAADPGGLAYTITTPDGIPVIAWAEGRVDADADEAVSDETGRSKNKLREAMDFLEAEVADGPVESSELLRRAAMADFAEATFKRAKTTLGIVPEKPKGEQHSAWMTFLPATGGVDAKMPNTS